MWQVRRHPPIGSGLDPVVIGEFRWHWLAALVCDVLVLATLNQEGYLSVGRA